MLKKEKTTGWITYRCKKTLDYMLKNRLIKKFMYIKIDKNWIKKAKLFSTN